MLAVVSINCIFKENKHKMENNNWENVKIMLNDVEVEHTMINYESMGKSKPKLDKKELIKGVYVSDIECNKSNGIILFTDATNDDFQNDDVQIYDICEVVDLSGDDNEVEIFNDGSCNSASYFGVCNIESLYPIKMTDNWDANFKKQGLHDIGKFEHVHEFQKEYFKIYGIMPEWDYNISPIG